MHIGDSSDEDYYSNSVKRSKKSKRKFLKMTPEKKILFSNLKQDNKSSKKKSKLKFDC